jgi:hypothetical protein
MKIFISPSFTILGHKRRYILTHTHTYTHKSTHSYTYSYTHTLTHTQIHTFIHILIHTHSYTHIRTRLLSPFHNHFFAGSKPSIRKAKRRGEMDPSSQQICFRNIQQSLIKVKAAQLISLFLPIMITWE